MGKLTKAQIEMLQRAGRRESVWGGKRPVGGAFKNLRKLQSAGYLNGSALTPAGRAALEGGNE